MNAKWIFVFLFSMTLPLTTYASDDFVIGGESSHQVNIDEMIQNVKSALPQHLDELFHQTNDPVAGNLNGNVTLVEFLDYQCPYCAKMSPVINNVIQHNSNLRVVFKEFPIRGALSEYTALMALAANLQGKYYAFHRAVMALRHPLTKESVLNAAKVAGLNINQLKNDMDSQAIISQLSAQYQLGHSLGLRGTPSFFIGKTNGTSAASTKALFGQQSASQLDQVIRTVAKS